MEVYYKHKQDGIIVSLDYIIKNNNKHVQWESSPPFNWTINNTNIASIKQINRKTYILNEIPSSKDWESMYDDERLDMIDLYNLKNKIWTHYDKMLDKKLLEYIDDMINNKLNIQQNLYKFNMKNKEES